MSTDTASLWNTLHPARRTTAQLLEAAERDTDKASVFMVGSSPADTDRAVFVIKGWDNIAYICGLLTRQGLLTEGKPVDRAL
jgi:hypothetical protein